MFVNSVNSNYVSFGWLCNVRAPHFMLMCYSVCAGATAAKRARPANGLRLPAEESAMLDIHNAAFGFKMAVSSCTLQETGERLVKVNQSGLWEKDCVYPTMQMK